MVYVVPRIFTSPPDLQPPVGDLGIGRWYRHGLKSLRDVALKALPI